MSAASVCYNIDIKNNTNKMQDVIVRANNHKIFIYIIFFP